MTVFDEAVETLRGKARLPTRAWTDLWEDMHARAFVVAGAMRDTLLEDFQTALTGALENGTTLADFRKQFEAIAGRHGWTGWTGEGTPKGRRWRARVIYDTNLRSARAAGRWKQIQRAKRRRPFLRYSAVLDGRTRPDHRAWHGTVLPADDGWWDTHYPPNGWYCRCQVIQISQRDLDRQGWTVNGEPPPSKLVRHQIKGRGVVTTPEGIDPGFGSNAGRAAWGKQVSDEAMAAWRAQGAKGWERLTPGDWKSAGRPERLKAVTPQARLGTPAQDRVALQAAIERAIGGDQAVYTLADGSSVVVNAEALARHLDPTAAQIAPLFTELFDNPAETWLLFERNTATGRAALRRRLIASFAISGRTYTLTAQIHGGVVEALIGTADADPADVNSWRSGILVAGD